MLYIVAKSQIFWVFNF